MTKNALPILFFILITNRDRSLQTGTATCKICAASYQTIINCNKHNIQILKYSSSYNIF